MSGRPNQRHRPTFVRAVTMGMVALVALGGTLAVTACSASRPKVTGGAAAAAASGKVRGVVALTGDSLTVGQLGSLPPGAEARGIHLLVAARVGRTTVEGAAALRGIYDHPDLVVVALGTNDATADLTATKADDLIETAMAVVDSDVPVLWLSLYRDQQTPEGSAADRFNLSLRRATSRHPNLAIADWRAFVVNHLDVMAPDGVHLTDAGYAARTTWMVGEIAARLPAA